jgi:hypothetical protein
MSKEKTSLDAILEQYASNNKPRFEKSEKVYDLKNYFNTFIKEGVKAATKEIRILPTSDNSSPFVEFYGHKMQVEGGDWKTFACLKHEKNEPCPFCEAREALLATGKDSDKELAKKYNAKLMYIVKIIDRSLEHEGVKFWRFNHDYRHTGIMDKIHGIVTGLKKDKNFSDAAAGRDLSISINRDQNNKPVVSSIVAQDVTPLSEDAELSKLWLADTRKWDAVYAIKTYDFLEILVKGGTPVWDKDAKKYVDKASKAESTDTLEGELTMGVENVKAGITTATTSTATAETEGDDLPF